MKRLILMRHAKTEPWNDGISDRDRMLVERGHSDAAQMALALKERGWAPDKALVSSARRTRETWRYVREAFPDCKGTVTDDLYLAGIPAMEGLVGLAAAEAECVILIGHNPGVHDFACEILRQAGSEDHRAAIKLAEKYPTGAAALFESPENDPFIPVYFKLVDFLRPKSLV
ncbi:MAG: histidine phosphatase family protein [Henriciella sp.]|uniref:SixA phosphatase family protein n=1 Tax=Henriciella sp. TaxID=1968823 RepID=UPI003C766D54